MEEQTKTAEELEAERQQETVETKTKEKVTEAESKVEKTVPLSVLIAERQKRQDAQRQLEQLQTRQVVQPQQEQVKEDEDPMPDDGDPVKLGAWGYRQEAKKAKIQEAQQTAQRASISRVEKGLAGVRNAVAVLSVEDPEFDTKFQIARDKGMNIPVEHEALIGDSADPQAMLKYLIANPAEAVRIQSLDVVGAAREITRLEAKLTQTETKTIKKPPAPIESVRGTAKTEPTGVSAAAARLFGSPNG